MKTFLIKIVIAGIAFFALSLSLILVTEIKVLANFLPSKISLPKGTTSHQWTRQREADTTSNVDVLIIGSSIAQSVDIREFEKFQLKAFNLASGSQSPIQSSYLIDKYLSSFNPKLVIWDVYPFAFSYTALESTLDLIANCQECDHMIPMLIHTNSTLAWVSFTKRLMLLPFEEQDLSFPKETKISKYIGSGYMETFYPTREVPEETIQFALQAIDIQKEIFESVLAKLNEKSIPVILIYSPKSRSYISNFQNQQEWFDYFQSSVNSGLASKFINFNKVFSDEKINKTHFSDLAHLTQTGVKNYNPILMDSLSGYLQNLN